MGTIMKLSGPLTGNDFGDNRVPGNGQKERFWRGLTAEPELDNQHHSHATLPDEGSGTDIAELADDADILRSHFAVTSANKLELNLLAFVETGQTGLLKRGNMYEGVFGAVFRRNEALAFLAVEPLNGTFDHVLLHRF